ncbi:hypothetical protein [uncultured Pseudodesulfovibrio sp.]|uniref:hypothetical protein n=1 Tax=uncultured Pseudodesulfovibrio sp. TaxID=2035858 RepID=UPI0029C7FBC3|nr:hypothetical protein [uncultured Pseudodesulfovibrio sp.]
MLNKNDASLSDDFSLLQILVCALLLICCGFVLIEVLSYCKMSIFLDRPFHCRETADVLYARQLAMGENPFSLQTFPRLINTYAPIYYYLGAVFVDADTFSDIAIILRSLAWGASGLTLLYLLFVLKKDSIPFALSLAIAVTVFTFLTTSSNEMGSKPGNLGYLFMVAGITLPYIFHFSNRSMFFGVFLIALAYFTKQYFIVGFGPLLTYYFLYKSKRKAVCFGVLSVVLVVSGILFFEFFQENSHGIYWAGNAKVNFNASVFFPQVYRFVFHYMWPLLLSVLIVGMVVARQRGLRVRSVKALVTWARDLKPNYCTFVSFFLLVFFLGVIGWHSGNKDIYIAHTFLFFFLWSSINFLLRHMNRGSKKFNIFLGTLPYISLTLILLFAYGNSLKPKVMSCSMDRSEEWHEVSGLIAKHDKIYTHRLLNNILMTQGKTVYDAGQGQYYFKILTPFNEKAFRAAQENYSKVLHEKFAAGYFDLLLVTPRFRRKQFPDIIKSYDLIYDKRVHSVMGGYQIQGWVKKTQ